MLEKSIGYLSTYVDNYGVMMYDSQRLWWWNSPHSQSPMFQAIDVRINMTNVGRKPSQSGTSPHSIPVYKVIDNPCPRLIIWTTEVSFFAKLMKKSRAVPSRKLPELFTWEGRQLPLYASGVRYTVSSVYLRVAGTTTLFHTTWGGSILQLHLGRWGGEYDVMMMRSRQGDEEEYLPGSENCRCHDNSSSTSAGSCGTLRSLFSCHRSCRCPS